MHLFPERAGLGQIEGELDRMVAGRERRLSHEGELHPWLGPQSLSERERDRRERSLHG